MDRAKELFSRAAKATLDGAPLAEAMAKAALEEINAARAELAGENSHAPMIAFGCAHPAKFPDAVERATGVRPELPPVLGDLFERQERVVSLPAEIGEVTRYIRAHARRVGAIA